MCGIMVAFGLLFGDLSKFDFPSMYLSNHLIQYPSPQLYSLLMISLFSLIRLRKRSPRIRLRSCRSRARAPHRTDRPMALTDRSMLRPLYIPPIIIYSTRAH